MNSVENQKESPGDTSAVSQTETATVQNGLYRPEGLETQSTDASFDGNELSDVSAQAPQQTQKSPTEQTISWTASESISHHKGTGWYISLLIAICVFAVLIWVVTKDLVTPVVVIVAGGILAGFAATQPKELTYQLGPQGLSIGSRHYGYNEFKSFTLLHEGGISSIMLRPLKRFGAWTTIYFEPKDEAKVVELMASRLPHEIHEPDAIDKFLRKIRF